MDPEVLSVIIAGSVSLVVSTVVAAWAQRRKLESDYDAALRAERLAEYRKLWQLMEPIGWYGERAAGTAETARKLLADLDHWYFEGGGLLLSDVSYQSFEELLRALATYNALTKDLRPVGSKLRTSLAYDIGGRKRPLLRPRIRLEELERAELIAVRQSSSIGSDPSESPLPGTGLSLWERINRDRRYLAAKHEIQARYGLPLPFDNQSGSKKWSEWMEADKRRGQAFIEDVHTLFKKFEVPNSWYSDFIADIAGLSFDEEK